MVWKIASKVVLCRIKNSDNIKTKYYVTNQEHDKEYVILHWHGIPCIVYDKSNENLLDTYNWSYSKESGYVYAFINEKRISMHCLIMKDKSASEACSIDKTLSVDHINYIKTFNVGENLRYATISQQISNRDTRKDKLPPPIELINIGITSLPRYIRYDNSEKKFVIERMHPGLEHVDGSFNYSGTKSTNVSVIYKYYDILKKLNYLDKLVQTPEHILFLEKQKQLYKEYQDISFLITGEQVPTTYFFNEYDHTTLEKYLTDDEKEYSRRGLPENFEIKKLPEYVCYVKEKGNRGDKFYISRHHPKLKASDINDVSTGASKKITTKDKYTEVMEILGIINSYQGNELKQILLKDK